MPYALFAVGCGLSIAAGSYLSRSSAATGELQDRARFLTDAQQIHRQIQSGLNSYLEVVRVGAVLLSADNEINGSEFRRFVNGLELTQRYAAMDGMGFAQCIRRTELNRVLRTLALDGSGIRLWPRTNRPESCPVLFLEPVEKTTRVVLGLDLTSQPLLYDTMLRARDTGLPQLSPKLNDLPGWPNGLKPNLVAFIPVYRPSTRRDSVEGRRRGLLGFVFSPLDSKRLIQHVVEWDTPVLRFEVYDGPAAGTESSLGGVPAGATPPRYETAQTLHIAGREWLFQARAGGDAAAIMPRAALQTFGGGVVLSFLLFVITRAQVRAWETAARHEAELRASAEALEQREAQAQAANRAKDEFLAMLSHELRTPLNVVLGWIGMLRSKMLGPERADQAIEIIERNAKQQAALIDDLLDVSRIITGKLHLDRRPLDFTAMVAAVVESLRPAAEAKGVSLQLVLADEAVVVGDPDRLRQTVWNLLSNALKFTPPRGFVKVELICDPQHARLIVTDTGVGISAEFLPHVFDRFQQADSSTTRAHSGVGLGLAIVRELVELHGGTVRAESAGLGAGARFTVSLPAALGLAITPAAAAERPTAQRLYGVRVLVVDDDPGTLEMLTEALRTSGADVTPADSARAALAQLAASRADVIVSDIAMPGEDGLWLMHQVRALPGRLGSTPAVALTALARGEDRARAINAGFQVHLAKPVRLAELQSVVGALAAGRAATTLDDATV